MTKLLAMGLSSLLGVGLAGLFQDPKPHRPGEGPPPPPKKKGAPGDELRKAYDLLRRVRSESDGGQAEERIHDWTGRATDLYRRAVKEREDGSDPRKAHELGVAAHDLARAVDHARKAARLDRPDPELPLPPDEAEGRDLEERTLHDLHRAYDRIQEDRDYGPEADAAFYLDAARGLYSAARRDAEAGRFERAGELARAAEAMTHVPEHLAHASGDAEPPPPPPKAEAKKKGRPGDEFGPGPDPKKKAGRPEPRERELPPPL